MLTRRRVLMSDVIKTKEYITGDSNTARFSSIGTIDYGDSIYLELSFLGSHSLAGNDLIFCGGITVGSYWYMCGFQYREKNNINFKYFRSYSGGGFDLGQVNFDGGKNVIQMSKNGIVLNGQNVRQTGYSITSGSVDIYINRLGKVTTRFWRLIVRTEQGVKKYDFIPAYMNNMWGIYDKVNKVFHQPTGGTFS